MGTRGFFFAFAIIAINAFCIGASGAEGTYGAVPDNIKDHWTGSCVPIRTRSPVMTTSFWF